MGKTARSKLDEAKALDKDADGLKTRDPEASRMFKELAHAKRRSAIKQMKRKPKRKSNRRTVL